MNNPDRADLQSVPIKNQTASLHTYRGCFIIKHFTAVAHLIVCSKKQKARLVAWRFICVL